MLRGASGPKSSSSQAAARRAARLAGADRVGDHQRGGRGEDEAVVARPRPPPRAGCGCRSTLTSEKACFRVADDVRLVQRAGMDHRLDAVLARRSGRPAPGRRPSRGRRCPAPGATSRPITSCPPPAAAARGSGRASRTSRSGGSACSRSGRGVDWEASRSAGSCAVGPVGAALEQRIEEQDRQLEER